MQYLVGLDSLFLENSIKNWLIFIAIVCTGILLLRLSRERLFKHLRNWASATKTDIDDLVIEIIDHHGYPCLYYLVFLLSTRYLNLPDKIMTAVDGAGKILLGLFVIKGLSRVGRHLVETRLVKSADANSHKKALSGMLGIFNFMLWSLGFLLLLDNLGIKVSALLTGMGIGGVAVALAAQAILGDLFAYFAILFDKPFEIGDFIITGDYMGTVEHIGIKTTKLRSLSGEQIIFSNSDLIGSRPRNYHRMTQRRIVFKVGVTYETNHKTMEILPEEIRKIIVAQPLAQFDRSHFSGFGDSSLNIETVYYVQDSDYNKYMDTQQRINLLIMEKFSEMGVDFAFPSRTIYMKGESKSNNVATYANT